MVNTYFLESQKLSIDEGEVLRYMGYSKKEPDQKILELARKGIEELKEKITLKACYEKYPISIKENEIDLGFTTVNSFDLAKNLENCSEIIVFAATLGIETDRLLGKYSLISPYYANTLQAVGASAIEKWCDVLCGYFEEKEGKTRPRYSPGYGDLKLEVQKDILNALEGRRKIGVHLTDSLVMIPTKSVTAIVGIKV